MRIKARLLIALSDLSNRLVDVAIDHHLDTDPACERYKPVKPGSRLDRDSRGVSCMLCMGKAAFGDHECFPYTVQQAPVVPKPSGDAS